MEKKESEWERVQRMRREGHPLMKGGKYRRHERQFRDVFKDGVLYSQEKK